MANEPLQSLADALKKAAQPVTVNSGLLIQAGLEPPNDLDKGLKDAFRLDDGGLQITFNPDDVSGVENHKLIIKNTKLANGFLGTKPDQTGVIITFIQPTNLLDILIEVQLSNWKFADFFTHMTGGIFDKLSLGDTTFIFSTSDAKYLWQDHSISLMKGQNFAANLKVPEDFEPKFKLVKGLGTVPQTLPICGSITLEKADNKTILYPDMNLRADINDNSVEIFYIDAENPHLRARSPHIGFRIQTDGLRDAYEDGGSAIPLINANEGKVNCQTPSLYFGLDVDAKDKGGNDKLTLFLESELSEYDFGYSFSLYVDPMSEDKLTIATATSLVAENSCFQHVPSPLQQFLANVQLKGFHMEGSLNPPSLSSLGVSLGSTNDPIQCPLPLFTDPTGHQEFEIKSFDLNWRIFNPLSGKPYHLINFTSTFNLWPQVFDGLFSIAIDQDLTIYGIFQGQVDLNVLLREITGGFIGLPSGISIKFSDVDLIIKPSSKSYAFAFTFNGEIDLIKWSEKPLIKFLDVRFELSANTPTFPEGSSNAGTVYQGSIGGTIFLGPNSIYALLNYDGSSTPKVWRLKTGLAEPLAVSDLINELFRFYELPDFIPGKLTVNKLDIDATIPVEDSPSSSALIAEVGKTESSYSVSGILVWKIDIAGFPIDTQAEIGLQYDGNREENKKFSGSVIGRVILPKIDLDVMVGYRFGPASDDLEALALLAPSNNGLPALAEGDSKVLWVQWEGVRASYDITGQSLTFTLNGWTVGRLIQTLVCTIGDPYFTLDSPWDFLNKISLDGLEVKVDLKEDAKYRLSADYKLPSPINLGFLTINGIIFKRVEGKITLAIDGSFNIPDPEGKMKSLFDPKGEGQDVKDMPNVPGKGNELFDLRLLVLGQRVGIRGHESFTSTREAIKALEGVPNTKGKSNPVNPTALEIGQPYYSQANNWLVAADFGLLKVGDVYTFDCMFVFNDPDIYGLRLAFNGEKAKVLDGLSIDILYRKITDDVGVYQMEFCLPKSLRQLNFGSFTVILPIIGIQIYTNGDFLFDFGFPYNLDFSRSFTVLAIVYGVPVIGSLGFYFGKLSNSTATFLPATTKGIFNPVVAFGLGIQLGLGYYLEKGPLKAGFSITVFGIVEGIIAPWHPYLPSQSQEKETVQSDYYFKLQGTFGIIGKLYGIVDFSIIKANVNLEIYLAAQITYESYRAIPLVAIASVKVSVSLTIDLAFFSIKISFSFSAKISQNLTIGEDSKAPWDSDAGFALLTRRARYITPLQTGAPGLESGMQGLKLALKPVAQARGNEKPTLFLHPAPQFTVLCSEGGSLKDQEGAFVFLLAMDAPTAERMGNRSGSSFESLCEALLPWVIDAQLNPLGSETVIEAIQEKTVSKKDLQIIMETLSKADHPLEAKKILEFLNSAFTINIQTVTEQTVDINERLKDGATIFPPFTGLSITIPDPKAEGTKTIILDSYVKITDSYREAIARRFKELAAKIEEESDKSHNFLTAKNEVDKIPLSQFILEDYFLLIARQLIQTSSDSLDDYAYMLRPGDSLETILRWAEGLGNSLDVLDIAQPNVDFPLTGGNELHLTGITYTVQSTDSLKSITRHYSDISEPPRWTVTPDKLILANASLTTLIKSGITINLENDSYTTKPGDSFEKIAGGLGISLEELAQKSSLYDRQDLLAASVILAIPKIAYTTAADDSDTMHSITQKFNIELAKLVSVDSNQKVEDIFCPLKGSSFIHIANLQYLSVSDLWTTIQSTDQISQIAGMAARYQLHGMRLPRDQGLELSEEFLYPENQSDYGLYQLIGQQFPIKPKTESDSYSITLSKDSSLSWVQFNGKEETQELYLDLTKQASRLDIVLDYARTKGYIPPNLTLEPLDSTVVAPKRYSMKSATLWSTSDLEFLGKVTAPPLNIMASDGDSAGKPQVRPILWDIPDSLLSWTAERQRRLEAKLSAKEFLEYLPILQPQVGITDPATSSTTFSDIGNYAMATRIEFQVKKLAQMEDPAPQKPGANDVVPPGQGNAGSPARPLAPFNYELIGPSPENAILLQRLLTSMDSLGEEMITGLFLLYPENVGEPKGLTSRGQSEFLSFITHTNLSTETNPPEMLRDPGADVKLPRGIVNSYNEFVKLLWELSTVRSGGYYLFYQLINECVGLPNSLFDGSDVATLTLVITYRDGIRIESAARLPNFINALVTMEAIDMNRSVVTMQSESSLVNSLPLENEETLEEVAALYSIGAGALARVNSGIALIEGKEITISGAFHQICPADLNFSDPLGSLASYYSRGAKVPVTAKDIADFNPGVPVSLFSVFRIPQIIYVVSSNKSGPSNTFASMQEYYHLPIDALAYEARSVGGLFASGTRLKVELQDLEVLPALGTGNLGAKLTRDNLGDPYLPDNPSQEDKDKYAITYLSSLYTLLTAGIYGNAFFTQSHPGLSFGPQRSLSQNEIPTYRHPKTRVDALAKAESESLQYQQAIGFGAYSMVNPAPDADPVDPYLPPKSANPYVGIGAIAQLDMHWLDVFGNRTVTPFEAPQNNCSGPMNCLPIFIDYTDRLIGLSQWPNVSASYTYCGVPGKPELEIIFKLNTDAYADSSNESDPLSSLAVTGIPQWQQNAVNDLKTFTKIYFQLNQNYDSLKIPGLSGKAVTISLTNTILESPQSPLSEVQSLQISAFVSKCLKYVAQRAASQVGGDIPLEVIKIPISLESVSSEDIIRLSVSLTFSRNATLSDPALRGIPDGLAITSVIMPVTNEQTGSSHDSGKDLSVSLKAFANDLENVFETADWQLRVGVDAASLDQPKTSQYHSVWAVRLANREDAAGLRYQIDSKPSFYAPRPIARCLSTINAPICKYHTGKPFPEGSPEEITFSGIDMNAWLSMALKAIDTFLSAPYAAPAFIIDQYVTPHEPEKNGYLAKILDHKKTLAGAISLTVEPILEDGRVDEKTQKAAQDKMYQKLLNELSAAFTVSAVTVFSVSGARFRQPLSSDMVSPPRFYGQPIGDALTSRVSEPISSRNQNFSLSTAKIPLTDYAGDGDSRLAFLFTSKNVADHPYVQLGLRYAMTHLEHDISSLRGIDGYQQSSWISFINGPFVTQISSSTAIPIILRALPMPPTAVGHAADQVLSDGEKDCHTVYELLDMTKWNYRFSYRYSNSAQDSVRAVSEFNLVDSFLLKSDNEEKRLFQSLAQFVGIYSEIAEDFERFLRNIDGKEPSQTNVDNAKFAVAAFERIVGDLSEAYYCWSKANSSVMSSKKLENVKYTFDIRLREEMGDARIDILKVSLIPEKALLPIPVIQIEPDKYTPESIVPPAKDAQATYRYRLKQTGDNDGTSEGDIYLSYQEAVSISERVVIFPSLDIFAYQSAQSAIQIVRNKFLVPDVETTYHFKFSTPVIKFADPVRPLLAYRFFDLGSVLKGPAKLEDFLEKFFETLFSSGLGQEVLVRVKSAYSYNLLPTVLDETGSAVLPRTSLSINLLPPEIITLGETLSFIAPLSRDVLMWTDTQKPSFDRSSQFNFDLSLFAAGNAIQQVQLLTIRDLFIKYLDLLEVAH